MEARTVKEKEAGERNNPDSFFGKKDFEAMKWNPLITPYKENIENEIEEWLEKLGWETELSIGENQYISYYIRMVDRHIEIGFANIEFNR